MTFFHVFLPPTIPASDVGCSKTANLPTLQFIKLQPPKDASQSLPSTLSQRRDRLRDVQQHHDVVLDSSLEDIDESHRQERNSSSSLAHGVHHTEDSSGGQPTKEKTDVSRRRSRRLRTTGSLLGTLPQAGVNTTIHERSETYSSLDTTNPDISQLPPTALPNESLSNLPRWRIPINRLTSLPSLLQQDHPAKRQKRLPTTYLNRQLPDKRLVTLMVCVMAVETPVLRQRKEKKAGREGTLWIGGWQITAPPDGDEEVSCNVKLWDNCAREWGDDKVRKGDVVLLENVEFKASSGNEPAHIVLSPTANYIPTPVILYRTLPRYPSTRQDYIYKRKTRNLLEDLQQIESRGTMLPQDRALRPDLRLGRSDAGVRKVGEIARWFAEWVGGEAPP